MKAFAAFMLLALSCTVTAQEPGQKFPAGPAEALDPAAVEAFVDSVMAESMARAYAPGAVVSVVEGDRLILQKGYGFANKETGTPIDPAHTLFRIASVTKLFTVAAALRLEDMGKLDLDTDINRYLTRVKIPASFSDPVTARLLMTHHGGFDTAVGYMDFPTPELAGQDVAQMSRDIRRVRPVTAIPLYDNMAFGVLGLVVADIMGTSYADAVHQLIFSPLGMTQSVVGLPDNRRADAALAYMRDAQWQAVPIPYNLMPTSAQGGGDISSTAGDMGKFMSALLLPGKLLQPQTLARMTDFDAWRFHPQIPGLGLGLWQYDYRGHPAEGHRGEINGFISRLALFRGSNVGVFISVNSTVQAWPQPRLSYVLTHLSSPMPPPGAHTLDPDSLIDGLLGQFADRFLPARAAPPEASAMASDELTVDRLGGTYFRLDASTHLMARVLATINGQELKAGDNGQMSLWGCPFTRKAPLYYECNAPDGQTVRLGFRVVEAGRIFASVEPVGALERQPVWRQAKFALLPVPVLVLLGLSAFNVRPGTRNRDQRRMLVLSGIAAGLFLIALILELEFAYDLAHSALNRLPILWRALFPVSAALLLLSSLVAARILRSASAPDSQCGRLRAAYFALLTLGNLGLIWFIYLWDLAWPVY